MEEQKSKKWEVPARCEACNKEIAFLKTKNGKWIPTNWESLNKQEKEDLVNGLKRLFVFGRHIAHFTDCPNAEKFRKDKK